MQTLTAIFAFAFGAILGSFLNVVILRFNTGLSPLRGRSKCFSCAKVLRWFEMIPVMSFFFLRGKCSSCKSKVSWQYPVVEILSGIIFLSLYLKIAPIDSAARASVFAFWSMVWCLLLVIFVYDIRHKVIPDTFSYTFSALALVGSAFCFFYASQFSPTGNFLQTFSAGLVLFIPFYLLWLFSGGKWIGLGDGKLALGLGWFLGLSGGIGAVILAFWAGAIWSIAVLILEKLGISGLFFTPKNLTMKSEVPFAPFLIFGAAVAFFAGVNFWSIVLFFN